MHFRIFKIKYNFQNILDLFELLINILHFVLISVFFPFMYDNNILIVSYKT